MSGRDLKNKNSSDNCSRFCTWSTHKHRLNIILEKVMCIMATQIILTLYVLSVHYLDNQVSDTLLFTMRTIFSIFLVIFSFNSFTGARTLPRRSDGTWIYFLKEHYFNEVFCRCMHFLNNIKQREMYFSTRKVYRDTRFTNLHRTQTIKYMHGSQFIHYMW